MRAKSLLLLAASCVVLSLTATAQTPLLIHALADPTPSKGDSFAAGIAAVGSDRVLLGAARIPEAARFVDQRAQQQRSEGIALLVILDIETETSFEMNERTKLLAAHGNRRLSRLYRMLNNCFGLAADWLVNLSP